MAVSRSSISSASVSPAPSTAFSPPVYVRRIVGMRTSMAIGVLPRLVWAASVTDGVLGCQRQRVDDATTSSSVTSPSTIRNDRNSTRSPVAARRGSRPARSGRRAPGRARCRCATGRPRSRCASGRSRPAPRRGRPSRGRAEQVAGVELVERRRPRRVEHRDEPLGPVGAVGPGDDAARLVRVVPAGVRDDRVASPGRSSAPPEGRGGSSWAPASAPRASGC